VKLHHINRSGSVLWDTMHRTTLYLVRTTRCFVATNWLTVTRQYVCCWALINFAVVADSRSQRYTTEMCPSILWDNGCRKQSVNIMCNTCATLQRGVSFIRRFMAVYNAYPFTVLLVKTLKIVIITPPRRSYVVVVVCLSVILFVCLFVCLSLCRSVSRISGERVDGRRPIW